MGELNLDRIERRALQEQCVHYWIIDAPVSPVSRGVCKRCGMVKEFSNNWMQIIESENRPSYKTSDAVHI